MPHRSAAVAASVLALLAAAAPAGADTASSNAPYPAFPENGLRIVGDRHGAILRFTGAAAKVGRFWRGKELQVTCDTVVWRQLRSGGIAEGWAGGPAFNGRSLRIGVPEKGMDYCIVRHPGSRGGGSQLVGVVAVSAAGRAWVTDLQASVILLTMPDPESTPPGRVPTIDEMLAENTTYTTPAGKPLPEPFVVALAGPDATPPAGKVGFWSDGRQHAVWAVLSPTGRRLFIEREPDDVVRSNLVGFQAALSDD
jgi:hypothetical protein